MKSLRGFTPPAAIEPCNNYGLWLKWADRIAYCVHYYVILLLQHLINCNNIFVFVGFVMKYIIRFIVYIMQVSQ